ncbi:MAG: alpha/beta hydrolase [Steroidobacteraceae bacterium]|nr:alpha/beta hydrolase [Steroidobacteraceae bacterium]
MNVRRTYVDGRYGQLHVRIAGQAPHARRPLLCFHLSPVSGVIYDKWLAEMGRDRLALAPDTPGYGMSDPPPSVPTIADYAAAMGDLADALVPGEFDVMGYHTGSKIAVELARQRPAQVRHLVLMSTPVYTDDDLAAMRVTTSVAPVAADGRFLVEAWQTVLRYQDRRATPESTLRQFPWHLMGGERRDWGYRAAFGYSYPENIVDVTAPILVFNPQDDLWAYTPRIEPYLKNGRVRDLPGWSHQLLDFSTADMAAMVRGFLDEDRFPA